MKGKDQNGDHLKEKGHIIQTYEKEIIMSKYLPWKSFEQSIVKYFRKAGFKDAKRNWSEQFDKKSGRDVKNVEPYCVQCKYGN